MAAALAMRGIGGLATKQDRASSNATRNVRVLAERRDSNIVVGPQSANVRGLAAVGGSGLSRKQQMQMEVLRKLEEENNWWRQGPAPSNVVAATSPKQFKSLILGASPDTVVVSYFFSPTCNACRTLYPKLLQIAKNNKEVLFVKCNTGEKQIASLADGLKISKIPWFVIFSGGPEAGQLASFTANLATVDSLRAEISGAKDCTAPECSTH